MEILLFDGRFDAYFWVLCTEKYFKVRGTPETEKMAIAAVAMSGCALKWWCWWSPRHPGVDWDTFTTAFLWRFKPEYRVIMPILDEEEEPDQESSPLMELNSSSQESLNTVLKAWDEFLLSTVQIEVPSVCETKFMVEAVKPNTDFHGKIMDLPEATTTTMTDITKSPGDSKIDVECNVTFDCALNSAAISEIHLRDTLVCKSSCNHDAINILSVVNSPPPPPKPPNRNFKTAAMEIQVTRDSTMPIPPPDPPDRTLRTAGVVTQSKAAGILVGQRGVDDSIDKIGERMAGTLMTNEKSNNLVAAIGEHIFTTSHTMYYKSDFPLSDCNNGTMTSPSYYCALIGDTIIRTYDFKSDFSNFSFGLVADSYITWTTGYNGSKSIIIQISWDKSIDKALQVGAGLGGIEALQLLSVVAEFYFANQDADGFSAAMHDTVKGQAKSFWLLEYAAADVQWDPGGNGYFFLIKGSLQFQQWDPGGCSLVYGEGPFDLETTWIDAAISQQHCSNFNLEDKVAFNGGGNVMIPIGDKMKITQQSKWMPSQQISGNRKEERRKHVGGEVYKIEKGK